MPMINYDGYNAIASYYQTYGNFSYIRKNQHSYSSQTGFCPGALIGVDLARNYGFQFAYDDIGSSGYASVCSDDYRGPSAFSEPETAAIRDFLTAWPNIFIALNIFAPGNQLVYPFSYDSAANANLKNQFPTAA